MSIEKKFSMMWKNKDWLMFIFDKCINIFSEISVLGIYKSIRI